MSVDKTDQNKDVACEDRLKARAEADAGTKGRERRPEIPARGLSDELVNDATVDSTPDPGNPGRKG
jgi:hypothetical protein